MQYFQNIKKLRQSKSRTQEDIANILNMPRQQYNRYETGKRDLPIQHLITLAQYYDVSLDYIAGRTDKPEVNR